MRIFFQNTVALPVVLMLLLVSSSCIPPKNAGIDKTLVNSENRGAHLSQPKNAGIDKTLVNSNRMEEDHGAHLSKRALDEYRKGNLAVAISLWKSVLVFDPNNAGVVKSINTATIQLKNLEQIKK